MKIVEALKNNRTHAIIIVLAAAVLIAAVCFYNVLPDDIKPGRHNPQKIDVIKAGGKDYDSVRIKWKPAKNASGYEIFRSTEEDGKYEACGKSSKPEYTDSRLSTGTEYWYMVRSLNGNKISRYSERVKAVPMLNKPVAKGSSTEEGAKITSDKVSGATGYVFYKDGKVLRGQPANVCIDGTVKENDTHKYQVAAYRMVNRKRILSEKSDVVDAGKIKIEMSLKDENKLEKIYVGNIIEITGAIKSNVPIKKIEAGAVNEKGDQWIEGQKFEKDNVNKKEFNLEEADKTLKFGELPEGKYKYRVIAYTEGGNKVVLTDQAFAVEDNPAMAAVDWAIRIANDNSFAYGVGKQAHRRGCYFCGTNSRYKPSGYAKTYCCNPFVLAAFAHGAEDPTVLKACQSGACGGMTPDSWTRYGCFVTVGSVSSVPFGDLQPGDFIISDLNAGGPFHHVWLYCGENQYVDAGSEGWGAGSISVKENAERNYNRYRRGGCYVMRYTGRN